MPIPMANLPECFLAQWAAECLHSLVCYGYMLPQMFCPAECLVTLAALVAIAFLMSLFDVSGKAGFLAEPFTTAGTIEGVDFGVDSLLVACQHTLLGEFFVTLVTSMHDLLVD